MWLVTNIIEVISYSISYSSKESFNFSLVIVTFEKNICYSFSYS